MQDAHDPYAALRHKDYRLLLGGNVLASFGLEMQNVAVGWELFERTHSAMDLGLVGLVQFLPVLSLALPAGHVTDRYNRKGVLLSALGVLALSSVGLAILSHYQGPVRLTYLCLFLAGVGRAFIAPARSALVAQVVRADALGNAVTWNSSGWQVASVSGPSVGGLVIAVTGQATSAYVLTALCFVAAFGLLTALRPRAAARSVEPLTLRSLLAGIHFVCRSRLILATLTLDLFAVLLGGATSLLPVFAKDILDVGPAGLGWLRAAPSLGALLMALVIAHRPPFRHAGRALLLAVAGFGAATIGFGLSENFLLSFALLAATGALDNISIVVRGTLVQTLTPDAMRGRVSAVNSIFIVSSNELGGFESGLTAELFGPVASVVGGGIGSILVVLAVIDRWPEVLGLGSLLSADKAAPPTEATAPGEGAPS